MTSYSRSERDNGGGWQCGDGGVEGSNKNEKKAAKSWSGGGGVDADDDNINDASGCRSS